jgi:hypothetical protein
MAFWEAKRAYEYAGLRLVEEGFIMHKKYVIPFARGVPQIWQDRWQSPKIRLQREDLDLGEYPEPLLRGSNFPGFYTLPAWDAKAIALLHPLVDNAVEYLPLDCDEGEFWLVNVLDVADCLDWEQSELTYFDDGGLKGIRRYVFKPDCLEEHHMFRTPEHKYSRIFVSDEFKALVENSNLVGLRFEPAPWEGRASGV